jgi:hypothetical protein
MIKNNFYSNKCPIETGKRRERGGNAGKQPQAGMRNQRNRKLR